MTPEEIQPKGALWLFILLALALLAAAVFYFENKNKDFLGSELVTTTPTPTHQARTYTVSYSAGVFSPTNLHIHAGDTVQFQNNSTNNLHVISNGTNGVLDLPGFDSMSALPPGGSFAFTFSQPGIFDYHNKLNENESGTIIVKP